MSTDLVATLAESPLGHHLGSELCAALAERARVEDYAPEEAVFRLGEPSRALYVVLEGQVKLVRSGPGYREHIVHLAERLHMFGEASLFLPGHPVSAIAVKETSLALIPRDHVLELMEREPQLNRYFLNILASWLNELIEKIDQLTLLDGAQRLSRYLLELAEEQADAGGTGPVVVQLPVRKQELAMMLNMNPPSLSRILRQLQQQGLIRVQGRRIALEDMGALRAMTRLPVFRGVRRDFGLP